MVLETMEPGYDGQDSKFVFKNTYAENEKVKMKVNAPEAPDEFFFVNIRYGK